MERSGILWPPTVSHDVIYALYVVTEGNVALCYQPLDLSCSGYGSKSFTIHSLCLQVREIGVLPSNNRLALPLPLALALGLALALKIRKNTSFLGMHYAVNTPKHPRQRPECTSQQTKYRYGHLEHRQSFVGTFRLHVRDVNHLKSLAVLEPGNRVECAFPLRVPSVGSHRRS